MQMITADYGSSYTYPASILSAAASVEDWSYHNDSAAQLHVTLHGGRHVTLFVEHVDRAAREDPSFARYTIMGWDEEEEQPDGDVEFETEDPYALIGYLFEEGER